MELRQLNHYLWMLENSTNTLKKLKLTLKNCCSKIGKELLLKEIDLNKWIIKNTINGLILWNKKI